MEEASSKEFTVRAGADGSIICMPSNYHHLPASILRAMHAGDDKSFDVSLFGVPATGEQAETLSPIRGHKNVLEHASKYLHDLLNSDDYTDSRQPVHHIENVKHDSLRCIVDLMYTNELQLNVENAIEDMCGVLVGAKYLIMMDLFEQCEAFLVGRVNRENCVKLWSFSRKHTCLDLMHATSTLIAESVADMPNDDDFLRLSYKDLEKLLLSEAFVVADDDQRCFAAVAWVNFDSVGRALYVNDIVNMIPLISVSPAVARKLNDSEMLWKHATDVMRKLMSALLDKMNTVESVTGSEGHSLAKSWYIMGGREDKVFLRYDIGKRVWQTLPPLPWRRFEFGACGSRNGLILVGGIKDDGSLTRDIDEYDVPSKTWSSSTAKLRNGSFGFEVCSNGQFAYALGTSSSRSFRGVEKYCLNSKTITTMANMPGDRIYFTAALANECIYVAGGPYDAGTVVEKYEILNNRWVKIGNINKKRWHLAGTITGDDFYLMGGQREKFDTLDEVEIFNMQTGQSRAGQKLLQARTGCRATTTDNGNVVCVIGGRGGNTCVGLKSIETFDKREGKWSTGNIVPDMPASASYFGLAAV